MNKGPVKTISDIARVAGVSPSTVSRVINNSGYVGKKTLLKVQNVISASGFRPNLSARSLATSKTSLIGLIIPNFSNPVYLEILKGVNAAASESGYSVVLSESRNETENIKESMMHLAALQVDAIVAATPEYHDIDIADYLTPFIAENIPIARLGKADMRWKIDGVATDAFESGRLAGQHLASLGYERIGLIGAVENSFVKRRTEGVISVLIENGMSPQNVINISADFTQAGGYKSVYDSLQEPDHPEVYLALNDIMAVGALAAADDLGLKVPDDVAVVGFDGIALGSLVRPRLSSVVLPTYEMGRKAFEMVNTRLTGEYTGEAREIVFHARMVPRDSSRTTRHTRTN